MRGERRRYEGARDLSDWCVRLQRSLEPGDDKVGPSDCLAVEHSSFPSNHISQWHWLLSEEWSLNGIWEGGRDGEGGRDDGEGGMERESVREKGGKEER